MKTSEKATVTTKKTAASRRTATTEPATGPGPGPAATTTTVTDDRPEATADPGSTRPEDLPVRPGEDPWTAEELAEVRSELEEEVARHLEQIETSNAELVGLLRDGSEGAGRDAADVGSTNFERDHEMSLANNAHVMLDQSRLALRHIDAGTYGVCDNCGQPVGKGRLQAFPRATLCVSCKQREERR